MAFVHVYVDSAATDDTGAGTVGDPWKTIQHAVDTVSATDGNQINIRSNAAHTTPGTTGVVWTSYSPTNSGDNPLIIRGYTTTENDGGVGEITGNNSSANLFSPTSDPQFVLYIDLKMHNTTGDILDTNSATFVLRCEIYNGGTTETLNLNNSSAVIGCYLHSGTSGARAIDVGNNNLVWGNFITGHDDYSIFGAGFAVLLQNLIEAGGGNGIRLNGDLGCAINNTIVGDATANLEGIDHGTSSEMCVIMNNIIKDWSGTSAIGLSYAAGSSSLIVGYNNFHNNTTDIDSEVIMGIDLTANDTTTDPTFTDAGNDDYRVGTNAQGDGYPTAFKGATLTAPVVDVGCAQRAEAGGSSSSSKQAGSGGGQVG